MYPSNCNPFRGSLGTNLLCVDWLNVKSLELTCDHIFHGIYLPQLTECSATDTWKGSFQGLVRRFGESPSHNFTTLRTTRAESESIESATNEGGGKLRVRYAHDVIMFSCYLLMFWKCIKDNSYSMRCPQSRPLKEGKSLSPFNRLGAWAHFSHIDQCFDKDISEYQFQLILTASLKLVDDVNSHEKAIEKSKYSITSIVVFSLIKIFLNLWSKRTCI